MKRFIDNYELLVALSTPLVGVYENAAGDILFLVEGEIVAQNIVSLDSTASIIALRDSIRFS